MASLENWYSVEVAELLLARNGILVQRYNGGFKAALRKAYPDLAFKKRWWTGTLLNECYFHF